MNKKLLTIKLFLQDNLHKNILKYVISDKNSKFSTTNFISIYSPKALTCNTFKNHHHIRQTEMLL
jgi:hypothetical protein